MFSKTQINLGDINVGSVHTLIFPYTEDVSYIQKITSPCECTQVTNDVRERVIVANYTARDIPIHLQQEGKTFVDKVLKIDVVSISKNNETIETQLTFTARVNQ